MKTYPWLFALLFLGICASAQAQRPFYRPNVYEVSLQLSQYDRVSLLEESGIKTNYDHFLPVNGVRYKYHPNMNSAWRLGAFYRKTADAAIYPEIRGGYERIFNAYKGQFFGGIDGQVGYGKKLFPESPMPLRYGASAFIGVRVFFNENWSITLENAGYYAIVPGGKNTEGGQAKNSTETGLNLAQVSLTYHWKRLSKNCSCGKPGS